MNQPKPTPLEMLRQVWANHLQPHMSWDEAFDGESLARAIVRSLHPFPDEMAAALDCWREQKVARIDAAVQRYKDPELIALHAATKEEIIAELARRAAARSAQT